MIDVTKPYHIRNWLNNLAYGTPRPSPTNYPSFRRADSLKKAKHGASLFMPNCHIPWMDGRGGNLMIHRSLNELIAKVKKHKVRGLGRDSNKKRGYASAEFRHLIQLLCAQDDFDSSCWFVAMTLYMKHLIHCVDDTANTPSTAPHGCCEFDFVIKTQTTSKVKLYWYLYSPK